MSMKQLRTQESGFTAIELLITLFVAAAFLIAGYQLFSLVVRDGGATRAEAKAANVAYEYMQRYSASATTPCSSLTPVNGAAEAVDGLVNVTVTVTITCANATVNTLSKVQATVNYNNPQETVTYATYVDVQP